MNLHELSTVSTAKITELKLRIERLAIKMDLIEESFTKGGGKGGQKINKTSNAVILRYAPLNLVVKCQRERQRNVNRFIALRELVDQIEMTLSPETSERLKEWERIRKQKKRRQRRSIDMIRPHENI